MKLSQIILFLVTFNICLTQNTDSCTTDFDSLIPRKCENIDPSSCSLYDQGCHRKGCSKAKDKSSCEKTLPETNFNTKKCVWEGKDGSLTEGECKEENKICQNYNEFGKKYLADGGDDCNLITDSNGKICVLENNIQYGCVARYSKCSDVRVQGDCTSSLVVSDLTQKCIWGKPNQNADEESCFADNQPRTCIEANNLDLFIRADNNICDKFKTSDGKKCVYYNGKCHEVNPNCRDYHSDDLSTCENIGNIENDLKRMPVDTTGKANEFNYFKKCVWDSTASYKCFETERKCGDYNSNIEGDDERCFTFKTSDDSKYECALEITESGKRCYEKYKTCKIYNDNTFGKNRNGCKNSLLNLNIEKECDYILGKDVCQDKKNYTTCSEYNETGEKDRIICESIKSPTNNLYCVLDKDDQCVEREPLCSEVSDEGECLHIAKASDANKKCAYDGSKCYEEYIRCEDYLGTYSYNCTNIRLYNGQQCEFDFQSNRCRTRNKFCLEARTEEECQLMKKANIGVSDSNRKVCGIYSYSTSEIDVAGNPISVHHYCEETFKYCSDYKGFDDNFCGRIKPYDITGEKIDTHYKCKFENRKCQKVPKDCSDAGNNPILCSEISGNIKDNSIKYCRFDRRNDICTSDYRTCESYKQTSLSLDTSKRDICQQIITENYPTESCIYEKDSDDNIYKCVQNKECKDFNDVDLNKLCDEVSPLCGYDSETNTCKTLDRNCNNIRFYSELESNEQICRDIEVSLPYKICTIKEDKSGCEEIFRDFSYSTTPSSQSEYRGTPSEEYSKMIRGLNLVMILLYLLF